MNVEWEVNAFYGRPIGYDKWKLNGRVVHGDTANSSLVAVIGIIVLVVVTRLSRLSVASRSAVVARPEGLSGRVRKRPKSVPGLPGAARGRFVYVK